MIFRTLQLIKERRKKLTKWIDTRIFGKSDSRIRAIPVFIEGEDPIANRIEIFVSVETDD